MFVFYITNFSPFYSSLVTQYLIFRERYYKSWLGICQGSKGSVVLISVVYKYIIMPEKHQYLEFFWSVFPHIRTEYGKMFRISPYTVQMWENTDQKISEYGHFSRSIALEDFSSLFRLYLQGLHVEYKHPSALLVMSSLVHKLCRHRPNECNDAVSAIF